MKNYYFTGGHINKCLRFWSNVYGGSFSSTLRNEVSNVVFPRLFDLFDKYLILLILISLQIFTAPIRFNDKCVYSNAIEKISAASQDVYTRTKHLEMIPKSPDEAQSHNSSFRNNLSYRIKHHWLIIYLYYINKKWNSASRF